jgi:hypothetical protein
MKIDKYKIKKQSGGNNMGFSLPSFTFAFNINQIALALAGINANFLFAF